MSIYRRLSKLLFVLFLVIGLAASAQTIKKEDCDKLIKSGVDALNKN